VAVLLAAAMVAVSCSSPIGQSGTVRATSLASAAPSGTPSSSIAPTAVGSPNQADQAVYAQIESQVQAIRGLQARKPVTPVLLDSAGVAAWLARANAEQTNHQAMADESRLFVHMGMLPAGSSLEQMELALQSSQVVGFYDPVSKGLYVLSESGGVGAVQKVTFSHEFTHALQDQNFDLAKLATDTPDQGDRDLARTALPEGDATLAMTQWSTKFMTLPELLSIANDPGSVAQQKQLNDAPPILRQTLLFPYMQGLSFVQGVYSSGGWAAVDRIYANPPASTSQIIHPELYTGGIKPVPVSVPAVPASLSGWKLSMQDTLGEFELGIWLGGLTEANSGSADAVSEWGGDRVGLYEGPNGQWAVVLKTAWRTGARASAFDSAAGTLLGQLGGPSRTCAGTTDVTVALASGQDLLPLFAPCAG
jgi:hypothetical protein